MPYLTINCHIYRYGSRRRFDLFSLPLGGYCANISLMSHELATKAIRIRHLLDTGRYSGPHEASEIAAIVQTSPPVVRQVRIRHRGSKDPRSTHARLVRLESRVRELERGLAALAAKRGL
jgi:hypothetical protein